MAIFVKPCNDVAALRKWLLHPPLAALGEDGLEVAFEEGAGVLEVLFGVGFGGGDARKRFVEDADDPPLFGERGKRDCDSSQDVRSIFTLRHAPSNLLAISIDVQNVIECETGR